MRDESLELEHIETLLDTVFGVVIALPLLDLPDLVRSFAEKPTAASLTSCLLLTSALLFSTFYWLEVRHFIAEQQRFDGAIQRARKGNFDGVPLSLAAFVLGSLLMMALAAASLKFSRFEYFQAFALANLLFWLSDLFGTFFLKRTYRPFAGAIENVRTDAPHEHGWFIGHIVSPFFYVYGSANASFFLLLFVVDALWGQRGDFRDLWRVGAAALVLVATALRHLAWRSAAYARYRREKLKIPNKAPNPAAPADQKASLPDR